MVSVLDEAFLSFNMEYILQPLSELCASSYLSMANANKTQFLMQESKSNLCKPAL